MLADVNDHRSFACPEALFSDCGSFCFLRYVSPKVAILSSVLLEKRQAKMQMPAVWDWETSCNGRLYEVNRLSRATMLQLRQAIDLPHRNGLRDSLDINREPEHTIEVNFTAIPSHLASARFFLLVGENGKDLIRILFLPEKGPPEIKYLHVTLNQILEKLAARSAEVLRGGLNGYEEWSSDMESEDAGVSADEDEQGNSSSGLEESSDRESKEVAFSADEDESRNLESN